MFFKGFPPIPPPATPAQGLMPRCSGRASRSPRRSRIFTGGIGRLKHLGRVVSRILSAPVAQRRGSFIYCDLTRSPDRFRSRYGPSQGPLFGLAPNGVYRAASLTLGAVGSYPTFSPLPRPKPWRFIFCGTFRQPSSRINCPRVSPAEPGLRGIVPYGVRTFLSR